MTQPHPTGKRILGAISCRNFRDDHQLCQDQLQLLVLVRLRGCANSMVSDAERPCLPYETYKAPLPAKS